MTLQKFNLIVHLKKEISEINAVMSYQARIRSDQLEALLVIDRGTQFITPIGTPSFYVQVFDIFLIKLIFLIIFFSGARKKTDLYQSIMHRPKPSGWE